MYFYIRKTERNVTFYQKKEKNVTIYQKKREKRYILSESQTANIHMMVGTFHFPKGIFLGSYFPMISSQMQLFPAASFPGCSSRSVCPSPHYDRT